ncbi:uncharacterized protein A1O9_04872 [Exophiala aquamarina CBS 119918]|uniref:GPI inositol-deacylase n=1 Tax=Exophiala aquamarina CBS 119918 TaxID=1182545 RepID=A0A072PJT0_9EURO|nr:uncharacterized protein A1O9_04872 [Exophiala aquamarina CBS 119918]KEF60022.1 hypothetical protein A1O9_04872 [Exophiala aquamarina CBS 119918]
MSQNPPLPPQPSPGVAFARNPPPGNPPVANPQVPPTGPRFPNQQPFMVRPSPILPSGQVRPTVNAVSIDRDATWDVYAIHGLNSDVGTWIGKPSGFNWLRELPNYLLSKNGEKVNTYTIGWNTNPLSPANISTKIMDSAKFVADAIIGVRGESPSLAGKNPGRVPRKVIIIGHSMGGILARGVLGFMHADQLARPRIVESGQEAEFGLPEHQATPTASPYIDFLSSVKGVILLASPSAGSSIGKWVGGILAAAAGLPGGPSHINRSHILALRPGVDELGEISNSFERYCRWYVSNVRRQLKVHAHRETKPLPVIGMVVNPESADIPKNILAWVDHRTDDLMGLNHMEVTGYNSMNDRELQKILSSFVEMQTAGLQESLPLQPPSQQSIDPRFAPLPVGGLNTAPREIQVPRRGGAPRGRGGAVMPPPSQLRGMTSGLQQGGQPGQAAAQGQFPSYDPQFP